MQFNSTEFLFFFFPLFLLTYYRMPEKCRKFILAAGSLIFYAFASNGNEWWLLVLTVCTAAAYGMSRLLFVYPKKWLLAIFLVVLLCVLSFFKVYRRGMYLPSGMSFYLFQITAYLIDTYRKRICVEENLLSFSAQIFMFPKLLSGPIMEPKSLYKQMHSCNFDYRNIHEGLQKLILGLCLKVLIANRLGGLWAQAGVVGYESISPAFAWLALLAYSMQLYFDFYGYSLMAIGIGKMLGFDLPANFLDPYASKTVSEFYRRWHVTLGAWFREYLYIPLGGNRKGTVRTILNLAVVWLFTGLWHGIGGNYLLWAGFLFLLIVNERLWLGKILQKSYVICHVYVVFVILLSWIPFAVGEWSQMLIFLGRLFGKCGSVVDPQDYITWGRDYLGILIPAVILATPIPSKICARLKNSAFADLVLLCLFWVVVYFISTAAQDPFMYFQY